MVFLKLVAELELKMTEGPEEHATQQLSENNEADEKPVEDGTGPDQQREESSQQLASGNNLFVTRPRVLWILNMYLMAL